MKTLPAINADVHKSTTSECKGSSVPVTTTAEEDGIINDVSKVLSVKYNELLAELKKADPLQSGLVCYTISNEIKLILYDMLCGLFLKVHLMVAMVCTYSSRISYYEFKDFMRGG